MKPFHIFQVFLLCIFGLTACSDGGNVAKIIEADVFVLDHSTSSTVWDSAQTRLVESVQNPWGTNIVQGEYIPSGELKVARSIHIIVVTDNTADRDPIEILSDESVDDVWSTFMTFTTNSVRAQELYDDFMADKNSFWSDVADEYLSEEKLAEPFQISSCESDLESNLDESKYADPLHLLDSETRNTAADVASTFCGFIDDVRGAFAELEIYKREISSDCADNSKCSDLPGAISTAIDIFDDAESDEIRSEALSNRLGYSKHYSGCVYFASDMISAATSLTQGYLQLNTLIRSSGLNDAAEMSTKAKEDLLDTTPKLSFEINVYMPSIGHSKSNLPVTDKQQSYLEDYWTNFFDESGFNHVETGSSSTACTGDEWSRQ